MVNVRKKIVPASCLRFNNNSKRKRWHFFVETSKNGNKCVKNLDFLVFSTFSRIYKKIGGICYSSPIYLLYKLIRWFVFGKLRRDADLAQHSLSCACNVQCCNHFIPTSLHVMPTKCALYALLAYFFIATQ